MVEDLRVFRHVGFFLRTTTNSLAWLSAAGAAACLGALIWHTTTTAPAKFWVLAAMVALAVTIEDGYRLAKREIRLRELVELESMD